jgi:tetratricopeptide (TPR) repeat protein
MNRRGNLTPLTVLLAFLMSIPASADITFDQPDQNRFNNDLRTVASLIRVGEYGRAVAVLDRMREQYGNDPRLTDQYKQAYKQAKLYPELEKIIRDELAKAPGSALLLSELGEVRFLQNDEAGADSLWNRALAAGRGDEMTYRFIADIRLRYGLYDSAIDAYLLGRRTLGKETLYALELASIYEAQRDYGKAVNEYLALLAESPDKVGIISTRIRGLVEDVEDSEEVIKAVNTRLKATPGRTDLYELLGDIYIKLGKMDKALENYKTISAKLGDDGQSLIRFATRAYDSKAYFAAITAIDEYFRISKEEAFRDMATLLMARAQMAAGQYDPALANFLALAKGSPDYRIKDEAGYAAGVIYSRHKGDCDSALQTWETMLMSARDPMMQNGARVETAVCHIKMGDYARAESLLTIVASTKIPDPRIESAIFLLGELSFYRGDFKTADQIFRQLVRQYPTSDRSNDALARIDVISLSGGAEDSSIFLGLFARAMKANMMGQSAQAAAILSDTVFEDSPIAEQAAFYAGVARSTAGNKEGAIAAFRGYIEKYPDGFYTDRAYLEMGDLFQLDPATHPDAREAYNKVLELYPTGPVTEIARQRLRQLEVPGKIG